MPQATQMKPDYGVDAPKVMRNFFVIGAVLLVIGFAIPHAIHVGSVDLQLRGMFLWTGGFFLAVREGR